MGALSGLKPEKVFSYFELLNTVPHGSGNTRQISDLVVRFAEDHGLRYIQDGFNNVIIFKAASKGYENSDTIMLQGHLDMVNAVAEGCNRDLTREGPLLDHDNEYVFAKGTSLGGDDCIAVAIMMALLDDDEIPHPALEAVFTTDEETGMNGASGLDFTPLRSKKMLNLDSEEEGVFTAGCAGGARLDMSIPVRSESTVSCSLISLKLTGFLGGHSGVEINCGRANAAKIMARMLFCLSDQYELHLASFKGGEFDNVIMPEACASIAVPECLADDLVHTAKELACRIADEFSASDPGISLNTEIAGTATKALTAESTGKILYTLTVIPQGVQAMSFYIPGLPQTSLNLGVVNLRDNSFDFTYSVRSSIRSQKEMLIRKLRAIVEHEGGTVSLRNSYPEWSFRPVSPFRNMILEAYRDITGSEGRIDATHGGLECGIFSDRMPDLDIVSMGPDLRDIHSPRERLGIASVGRLYDLVKEILRRSK